MKTLITLLLAAGIGFAAVYVVVSNHLNARHAQELAAQQAAWQTEKEQLQADLEQARKESASIPSTRQVAALPGTPKAAAPLPATASTSSKLAPSDILARLQSLKLAPGPGGLQTQREMVRLLDDLVRWGPAALPAIRDFLASNADVEFAPGKGKGPPGPQDSLLPSSLRAGLLSAVQEIGGPVAEQILAQALGGNTRPAEVLKLAQMLEQMNPGKYRDTILAAAQAQLTAGATGQDRKGLGQLYDVLAMYGDKSYAEQARAQLVQADGRLNKEALDYLQTTLKQENLPVLRDLLQNPQLTDPKQREDVVKYVTELAGTDQQASQLWYESALNANLPDKAREKAITELDKRGFQNREQFTAYDLQLAQTRLQLLDALRAQIQDPNQLALLDQAKARLTILMDPNLRQALHGGPKGGKAK